VLWDIKRKKILSEIICYYFVGNYESGAIFCVNYNLYKGMINRKGKMVFPMEWDEFIYENEAHPLHTGYACLQNAVTHKWSIFNKKGKEILSNIDKEFYLGNSFFKGGFIVNNTKKIMWYSLHKKVFMDNSIYIDYYEPLSNGLIACRKTDSSIVILNKKLKKIKLIKNGGQVKAVGNHYWIQSENRKNYNCFNSKGQITATIEADDISFESYGHIPFMKDSLWGLATESGKIIINPSIREYDKYDQQVKNGYWEIRDQISSEKIYYTYYNLEGKIVLRTSAAEDGWELLRSQETYSTNYIFY
jgi:hypothetical protein